MTEYQKEWRYLRSEDKHALALAEQYKRDSDEWMKKCSAFQEKHHVELAIRRTLVGDRYASGVSASMGLGDLPAEWCKPNARGVRKPYESNKDMRRLFRPLTLKAPKMPGIEDVVVVELTDGRCFFCGTTFFTSRGVVWTRAGASAEPDSDIWQPVKEWEFMRAKEEAGHEHG